MQSLSFQSSVNFPATRTSSRPYQSLSFQSSVNFPATRTSFRPYQSLSFQSSVNFPATRTSSRPYQSLSFQSSVNFPATRTSSRPYRALSRFSMIVCWCLNLNDLRRTASRLEDHIVFTLLERTIYSYDRSLYNMHVSLDYENEGGLLRMVVSDNERLQAALGAYKVSEEVPFFPNNLPEEWYDPDAVVGSPPLALDPVAARLNMNNEIWSLYNIGILSHMNLKVGNDGRQGSALSSDASCLQTISKRVNLGKSLAEAKFQLSSDKFEEAVKAQDIQLLNDALACHEQRDAAAKRYIDMANAIRDKQLALAANVCLCLVLPVAEKMEREYIVVKLSRMLAHK